MTSRKAREEIAPPWLQSVARREVAEFVAKAANAIGRHFYQPRVKFTARGGTAGKTHRWHGIALNPVLLMSQPEAFLDEVIPHEVAHWVCMAAHGDVRPHGSEWVEVMGLLGVENPRPRYSFDVIEGRPFIYGCNCDGREHRVSTKAHGRAMQGELDGEPVLVQPTAKCRDCGVQLHFVEEDTETEPPVDKAGLERLRASMPTFSLRDAAAFLAPLGLQFATVKDAYGTPRAWDYRTAAIWATVDTPVGTAMELVPWNPWDSCSNALELLEERAGGRVLEYVTSEGEAPKR
jgi:SprT protein